MKQFWQTNKKWINFLKIVLSVLVIGFVVYKLLNAYQIDEKFVQFQFNFSAKNILLLSVTILLLFVNIGLETAKWHLLINQFEKISFANSLKAIFSGVTLSIITPNQIGDFVGRVIHLQTLNKIKGSLVVVIGHTAQVLVTGIIGLYALLALMAKADFNIYLFWKPISVLITFINILAVLGFLRIDFLYYLLSKTRFINKIEKYIIVFKSYTKIQLSKVVFYSLFRYAVFVIQYVLLLQFFDVHIGLVNCFIGVILVFFIQLVAPSFILLDIGLRGAAAIFVFEELSNFDKSIELGVLLSSYSLWIINRMIPAFIGLIFILKHRFTK